MSRSNIVIAIDGPAASGKSTVAKTLAKRLDFTYVNTGAMYRAFTWFVLEQGVDPADSAKVLALLSTIQFESGVADRLSTIRINGVDPSAFLNDCHVAQNVSAIASIPEVRDFLVEKQRQFILLDNIVMEGRDIGSVVFPNTPCKFYIDASPEVRARRRALEGFKDDLQKRDHLDSSRKTSPLVIPKDAFVIDSSGLQIDEVVQAVVDQLEKQGALIASAS